MSPNLAVKLALSLIVLTAAGCETGPAPSQCGPDTCAGCCQNGFCLPGAGLDSCGQQGNLCDTCVAAQGQACIEGKCQSSGAGGGTASAGGGNGGGGVGGGGQAGGEGEADGGSGGGGSATPDAGCSGRCLMFQRGWTANPAVQAPYGSGGTKVAFIDDSTLVASVGVLRSDNGSAPYVRDGHLLVFSSQGAYQRELGLYTLAPKAIAVEPGGLRIAVGGNVVNYSGTIDLLPISGAAKTTLPSTGSNALAFSTDGKSLFTGGTGDFYNPPSVSRIDLLTGSAIHAAVSAKQVIGIIPSATGSTIEVMATGVDGSTASGNTWWYQVQSSFRSSDLMVTQSVKTEGCGLFETACRTETATVYSADPRTHLPFTATPHSVMKVLVPGLPIIAAVPHPTLPLAVTLHSDGTLRLIDLLSGRVEDEIRAALPAADLAISPDGTQVVVVGQQGDISSALASFSLIIGIPTPIVQAPHCGNGVLDPTEACDGAVTATCASVGYAAGTLKCKADCSLDLSACTGRAPGWSCPSSRFADGVCDCGCDAPDPDCGQAPTAAACGRSSCSNGTRPSRSDPTSCVIDSCANIGPEGRCNNGGLEVCTNGAISEIACTEGCLPRFGAPTCGAKEDEACIVGAGDFWTMASCGGDHQACVYGTVPGGRCEPGHYTCGSDAITCVGDDRLQVQCTGGQPLLYDCYAMGGRCGNNRCQQLPSGAACGTGLVCAQGLTCASGTCQ